MSLQGLPPEITSSHPGAFSSGEAIGALGAEEPRPLAASAMTVSLSCIDTIRSQTPEPKQPIRKPIMAPIG